MTLSREMPSPEPADDHSIDGAPSLSAAETSDSGAFRTALVGPVPIAITNLAEAVEWLHEHSLHHRGGLSVRLVNAFSIVSANRDARYLDLMRSSGVSFPDGTPVMLALRLVAHERAAGRVRGPSFFVASLRRSAGSGLREFFLGTTDETLQLLSSAVERSWPRTTVAGVWAPPFADTVSEEFVRSCAAEVALHRPDRVWVALGTPKQDYLAERLSAELGVPCIAVGAAFDFLAGTKREAPRLFQMLGAEWVFRLASEPRRLWRRYVFGNVAFLRILLQQRG